MFALLFETVFSLPMTAYADGKTLLSPETATVSEKYLFSVETHLPNPCHFKPQLSVSDIDLEKQVVTFKMTAQEKNSICIQIVGPLLTAQVDLLLLPIPSGKDFKILFEGVETSVATFKLPPRFVVTPDLALLTTEFFSGKLVRHEDEKVFLEGPSCSQEIIANQATENGLVNQKVTIWGFKGYAANDAINGLITPLAIITTGKP